MSAKVSVATAPDLIDLFVEPLASLDIPYMITGGVASVIYGDPRFTRDIDLVIDLRREDAPRLATVFPSTGFYVPPLEVIQEETSRPRSGHLNVIHQDTALKADLYLAGDDPLHAWALARRCRLDLGRTPVWLAPVEYVILRKLEYFNASGSERHLRDVAVMLRVSSDAIGRTELERWADRLDLRQALDAARSY